ncbi:MAG TPA: hypothetical protein GX516_05495 [Thermoanaerobacter sp.]|nr:hypothetical protein [Thermoanaerobacter sp.]
MPLIVLISGYAGSGKDIFGNFLIKHLPGAKKYAFADPIKEIARKYFEWDGIKDERGRNLLIGIGTAGREENLYIWAERVIEKITEEQPKTAIITDWRFKHEHFKIKEVFGDENTIAIRIKRERLNTIDDITEHDLDNFLDYDFVISNNGSLQGLEEKAKITAEHIQNIHFERKIIKMDGFLKYKIWFKGQEYHKEDGPAFIEYYFTGAVKSRVYLVNGKLHRENGPAIEKYAPNGSLVKKEYFLNGKTVSEEEIKRYRAVHDLLGQTKEAKKIKL